jgi:multicomponent Na+:H+ antiporter subunit G
VTAVLTVLFMLLTLSVASQLLARAAYMSGATLQGLDRDDPLSGVLDRAGGPKDEGTDLHREAAESDASRPG